MEDEKRRGRQRKSLIPIGQSYKRIDERIFMSFQHFHCICRGFIVFLVNLCWAFFTDYTLLYRYRTLAFPKPISHPSEHTLFLAWCFSLDTIPRGRFLTVMTVCTYPSVEPLLHDFTHCISDRLYLMSSIFPVFIGSRPTAFITVFRPDGT